MTSKKDEAAQVERDNRLRKAYGAATQELREAHRDEFNEAMIRHAKELEVEWKPRRTAEERAQDQFDALLEQYPGLADRMS